MTTSERLTRIEQDIDFAHCFMHADEIFSSIELSDVYFLAKLATCMQQNGATICGKCRTPFMDTNKHFPRSCSATKA